jgi:precorrin-2 dehydrogenase/sirohydrochlorin ferrochelatase
MCNDGSDQLSFLPLGIDVQGRNCVVIGGGNVGTRKALTLARAGAVVTVVSPTVTAELAGQIDGGQVHWTNDSYREELLSAAFLVVAATDKKALNADIVRDAIDRGALVCDASSAERSQVIFGALLKREDVTVAVFTDGRNPARARRTRDQIARALFREQ